MDQVLAGLLDAGVLGSTVVILWFSHWKLQQRIDTMATGFAETVTALQDKQDAREDKIRERYDAVLLQHSENTEKLRQDREKLRDSLELKVSHIETMISTGLQQMREAKMHALAKGKGGK